MTEAQPPLCRCGHIPARHVRFDGSARSCMTYDCQCPGYVPNEVETATMRPHDNKSEFTLLWNEWLTTDDGKSYEAGWSDFANRWHAERGKAWVYERMIEARDERIQGLEMERDSARLDRTACEGRLAAVRAEVVRLTTERKP